MIAEFFSLAGLLLVLYALYARRIALSLLALATGSVMIAYAISELAGWVVALLVASLYAGALVALMAAWAVIVAREEARVDTIYVLALVFLFFAAFSTYLLISGGALKPEPLQVSREADLTDYSLLAVLLLVALLGGLHVVRGGEE